MHKLVSRLPARVGALAPYFTYAVAFLVGSVLLELCLELFAPDRAVLVALPALLLGVIPGAVLLARRVGEPSAIGLLVTALLITLANVAAVLLITAGIGPAGAPGVSALAMATPAMLAVALVEIAAPPAWLLLLRRGLSRSNAART